MKVAIREDRRDISVPGKSNDEKQMKKLMKRLAVEQVVTTFGLTT